MRILGHVLVHILGLNLKEQAVCVGVKELTTVCILSLHLVVVEAIHKVFGGIHDAYPKVHWAVGDKAALVDLDGHRIIIEDVCTGNDWAGDKASDFVPFACADQLDINSCPEVFLKASKTSVSSRTSGRL